MPNERPSWFDEAAVLGYANEREMLENLYVKQGWSLEKLSVKLGYSIGAMRRHLQAYDIEIRPRGGDNSSKKGRLLAQVPDKELVDAKKAARKYACHISTVFNEVRKRRKEGTWQLNSVQSDPQESCDSSPIQDTTSSSPNGGDTSLTENTTSSGEPRETTSSSTTESTNGEE